MRGILEAWCYRELVRNLVLKDLRLKYRSSVLGLLWSLANPLLLIVVYTFAFQYVLKVRTPNYSLFLLVGILHWNLFAHATSGAAGSIVDNGSLIKKVSFPAEILPISAVLFAFAQYLLALLVFLPATLFWFGVHPGLSLFAFVAMLALLLMFVLGAGLLFAALTVTFRDMKHLIEVLLMLLFWATPIVYDWPQVPARVAPFLLANPMTPFILGFRSVLFDGAAPVPGLLGLAALYATGTLALGSWYFVTKKPGFAEEV